MDEITRKWFDVRKVEVVRAPELVLWHTDEELIRLAGAPSGSRLSVTITTSGQVELLVENDLLLSEPMVRYVVQEPDGYAFHIVNAVQAMNASSRGQGIGSRSMSMGLFEASRHQHFRRVRTMAVGDASSRNALNPLSGYYLWPRMGFDAELPQALMEHADLPEPLRGTRSLLQLIASEDGLDFWARHGSSLWVEFDLRSGSDSWRALQAFMLERGIQVEGT